MNYGNMKSKHSNFAGKPPNIALEFGKNGLENLEVGEFHCCDKLRTLSKALQVAIFGVIRDLGNGMR